MSPTTHPRTTETDEEPVAGHLSGLTGEQIRRYEQIPDEVDFIDHESFEDPATEAELFGDEALEVNIPHWNHFPEVVDDSVEAGKAKRTRLRANEEAFLFRKYNYACYRLAGLVEQQSRRRSAARSREMLRWYERAMETRASLVRANMALVLAMAKRTRIPNVEFSELVSEGNMALLRSVEKFDVSRGFKFSTYACRAILKSFNRLATKTGRYRQHFPTEFDPDLERSDYDVMKHEMQRKDSVEGLREILARNKAKLSPVEQTIVTERFALTSRGKKRTLSEVGKMVGLTNERVRQIQNIALEKIRSVLTDDYLVV